MVSPQSMEALSRISEEQFRKFMEQGVNPAFFQQPFAVNMGSIPQQPPRVQQPPTKNSTLKEFRQEETKLFKRASYHVGLAYYIHV